MVRNLAALLAAISFLANQTFADSRVSESNTALATFGGGCFWCIEAVFKTLPGVTNVTSGYAGGNTTNPTYSQVCTGKTGHAEVVQIEYDRTKVSYEELLDLFWRAHDPTTLNRQGADVGTQYRSIILASDVTQRDAAERSKAEAQKAFRKPIVTEIAPLRVFYPAETYHQDFYARNAGHPYCQIVIKPKLNRLKKQAGQSPLP